MAEVLKRISAAFGTAVEYLQTIKISEIRQTLEFLGVQHIEVVLALLFFVMLQFTKFTAVLVLACMIAYGIFYMWDTWFPEVKESLTEPTQNADYGNLYGTPYWNSYGPSYGPSNISGNGYGSGANSNYDYTYTTPFADTYRDARTSALFPPYSNSEIGETLPISGDHMYDTEEKHFRVRDYASPMPISSSNLTPLPQDHQRKIVPSGTNTPVANRLSSLNMRPQRRNPITPQDDNLYGRRDPLAFRRMIANDYRMYRPTTSSDVYQYHNYTVPVPEERARRLPGLFDEYRLKNRRNTEKRPSTQKKYYGTEQFDRFKNASNENLLHRSRNNPVGTSNRSSGPHGRSNAGNYHNLDTTRKKGRK